MAVFLLELISILQADLHCAESHGNASSTLAGKANSVLNPILITQIENESIENIKGFIPFGLHDDMRHLAKTARDLNITVPLFHNDAWEMGSFVARPDSYRKFGKPVFGLDLYGFDK